MFFSLDGLADFRMLLKVHQPIEPILAGKAWDQLIPVLVVATLKIIRNPDVQNPRTSGHYVDPVAFHAGDSVTNS